MVITVNAVAQTADFSLPASVCRNQNIPISNQSSGADRYEWDFCQGDLALTPVVTSLGSINGNVVEGLDVVFDGQVWLAFVADRDNNSIVRLNFGADITSTPTITRITSLGGALNRPSDIRIVSEGGLWYGFVYCTTDKLITRLDFGSSLLDLPTAALVIPGNGGGDSRLDVANANGKWYVMYTLSSSVAIVQLNTITTIPTGADIHTFPISGVAAMAACRLVEDDGAWFGYTVSYAGAITLQRLSFGNDLFSTPTIDVVPVASLSGLAPYGLDVQFDNGIYNMFITTVQGAVLRVDLGDDLSQPPISDSPVDGVSVLNNNLAIRLAKSGTRWHAFTLPWSVTTLYRMEFPNANCMGSLITSTDVEPVINYHTAGDAYVSLRAYDGNNFHEVHQSLEINATAAPVIDFTSDGRCVNNATNFIATPATGIQNYDWTFGDTGTGSVTIPGIAHTYSTTSSYLVELEVEAANGCSNYIVKQVEIYNPPAANFTAPAPVIVCTNQDYSFNNTSTFDNGSAPTWNWEVDGVSAGTSEDLLKNFATEEDFDVKLTASIPGCASSMTKTFSVQAQGPLVDFTSTGQCKETEVNFNQTVIGSQLQFFWDFDDGASSTDGNTTHNFTTPGTYMVSLTARNVAGCENFKEKELVIYDTPQPSFNLDLPPFSCSGTPSQFHDLTPPPNDSNLQQWLWNFGDNGTGSGKNPVHTYPLAGNFNVSLEVVTDKGCRKNVVQSVTIAQSPTTQYQVGNTCVNQPAAFTGSDSNIETWQWRINQTNYNVSNPVHVFVAPGTYNVQLVKTGVNDCVTTINNTVVVPIVPDINFTTENPCTGQETLFLQDVNGSDDQPMSFAWTLPGNTTATGPEVSYEFENAGTFPVTLRTVTMKGCTYSLSRNISVFETPEAKFTASPSNGPSPLRVQFTNQSTGAVSYHWNFNDDEADTSDVGQPQHTFDELGEYTVDLVATSDHGCADTFSASVNVIVPYTELELVSFNLAPDQASGAWQSLIRVKNNSNYPLTTFNVILDLGFGTRLSERISGELLPGEIETFALANQLIRSSEDGYVCVELTLDGDAVVTNNTSCQPLGGNATVFAPYPNPAKDYLNVSVVAATNGPVEIHLVNAMGANVYRKTVEAFSGLNVFTIDLTYFDTGIYVAIVRCGEATTTSRILVE